MTAFIAGYIAGLLITAFAFWLWRRLRRPGYWHTRHDGTRVFVVRPKSRYEEL